MDKCDSASVLQEGRAQLARGAQKGTKLLDGSQGSPEKAVWSSGLELNFDG